MGQGYCLSHHPIDVKRHHDYGNSYKGKHLIEAGLQFQRVSPLLSWQESWQHMGRHGAGQIAESSTSEFVDSRNKETLEQAWTFETLKPTPSDILPLTRAYVLQQGHTS